MAGFADDQALEHTLCQVRSVHVFKIPPRTTSGGHRASDWSQEVWQGSLKVVQKGTDCGVFLVDSKDGSLFAMCPVKEGAVERCVDSSRYFVLKIQNAQGRHAFIGVAFNEREEAFDFNVALQEFEKDQDREAKLKNGTLFEETAGPSRDLSLKEGEKISIKLPPGAASKRRSGQPSSTGAVGGALLAPPPGSSSGLLAPPPKDGRRTGGDSLLGDLGAPGPAAATGSGTSVRSPVPLDDGFGALLQPARASPAGPGPTSSPLAAFDPLAGGRGSASPPSSAFDSWGPMASALSPPHTAVRPAPPQASPKRDPFADLLG